VSEVSVFLVNYTILFEGLFIEVFWRN